MPTEWTTASLQAHLLGQLPANRIKRPDEETLQCPCAECELIKKQWHDQEAHDKKIGKEIAEKLAVQKALDTKKAEIEALKAKVAAKKAAEAVKLAKARAVIAENVAKAQAVKAVRTFRGNLAASIAGKNGKYGGQSPYNDLDVKRAREYLIEMEKDPDAEIDGRSAAHMIAEFACFWLNDLKAELRKQANTPKSHPQDAEYLEAQISRFERRYKDL